MGSLLDRIPSQREMMMNKKRKIRMNVIRGAGVVLLSVVVCCLILESALRIRQRGKYGVAMVPGWLRMGDPPVGQWHPFLRSVPRPLSRWLEVDGEKKTLVTINSLGFRSQEIDRVKPTGVFRVVCVGGSVVYDTRVGLHDSWPMRLQSALQKKFPEHTIEIVNAGLPGRTSADTVVNLALRALSLSPDVVIVQHGVNDQKPNTYPGFQPDYSHWYRPRDPVRRFYNNLLDKSLLACHLRYRLMFLLNPSMRDNWRGEDLKRYDTVFPEGLQAYERNMKSIVALSRTHGAKVVIATVGHSLEENGDWASSMGTPNPLLYYHAGLTMKGLKHAFAEYNRVNRKVAKEMECVLVDVEGLLAPGKKNFQDDVHYTVNGARRVADVFVAKILWGEWMGERDVKIVEDVER